MTFRLRRVNAFSLVELTLALGVAAFCLLAVFGLMPIGVQTNRNTDSQAAAVNIMAAVIADLRAASRLYDPSKTYYPSDQNHPADQVFYGGNCYIAVATTIGNTPPNPRFWGAGSPCPRFGISFGTSTTLYFDTQGQFATSIAPNSRYQLNVIWNVANGTGACSPALPCADLKVTWPAAADPTTTTPSGSAEMFAGFNRN
jgi:type II secretory pathway pseudopilin PulG